MLPQRDEDHGERSGYVRLVSRLLASPEFLRLRKELARRYRRAGMQNADRQALEDALYACLVEFEEG